MERRASVIWSDYFKTTPLAAGEDDERNDKIVTGKQMDGVQQLSEGKCESGKCRHRQGKHRNVQCGFIRQPV